MQIHQIDQRISSNYLVAKEKLLRKVLRLMRCLLSPVLASPCRDRVNFIPKKLHILPPRKQLFLGKNVFLEYLANQRTYGLVN